MKEREGSEGSLEGSEFDFEVILEEVEVRLGHETVEIGERGSRKGETEIIGREDLKETRFVEIGPKLGNRVSFDRVRVC